jgi:nicotinate-nucleotide pyrophosphorylase (carboxylating)
MKGMDLPIEVETRNMKEVEQVLVTGGVDRIMLDNFTPEQLKVAVDRIAGRYETEASGGINLSTIRSYAVTGVDMISVGALTHSVPSLDLSLKAL